MAQHFGTWQIEIMETVIARGAITFYSVAPRGRAAAYNGRYKASFESLDGVQYAGHRFTVGPVGPRGGIGLTATAIE